MEAIAPDGDLENILSFDNLTYIYQNAEPGIFDTGDIITSKCKNLFNKWRGVE